jgi:putative salt-induced outer membrane protein YdiY
MVRRFAFVLLLVAGATTAHADALVLANGDKINGEIVSWAVDHVVIDHPQLGRIRLELDELHLDTGKPPSKGLFRTDFMRGWQRNITFGLSGKKGNSLNTNLTGSFAFDYDDEFTRWKVSGRYFFSRDEDGVSDNNGRANVRRDWLVPDSQWFGFAAFRYQFDEFESWVHRTSLTAGPGYELFRNEAHSLDTRLGGAFTREFGERQTSKAESLFALDYAWKPAERYTLSLSNQLFLQLIPNGGEVRNLSLADLKIALLEEPALSLTIGAENEYETDAEEGDKANDIKYYLSLGVDF